MQAHPVAAHHGARLELDLCHACHGLWFDGNENLRMAPQGVVDLFRDLHAHRDDAQGPLSRDLNCPRCKRGLVQGADVVRTGRYITYRCPQRHGRFSTFSSFMIEKGFVRQLTKPEIADLADALVALERDRERAKREEQKDRWSNADASGFTVDDLWSAGVDLVWNVLRR